MQAFNPSLAPLYLDQPQIFSFVQCPILPVQTPKDRQKKAGHKTQRRTEYTIARYSGPSPAPLQEKNCISGLHDAGTPPTPTPTAVTATCSAICTAICTATCTALAGKAAHAVA